MYSIPHSIPLPAAIVDIETTGGNVTYDRITEIGIIEITEEGVSEWSTLVNPRQWIPDTIQRLTGIDNGMVEAAPFFEQVAKEIVLRLQGKLLIAHNVRFDYGFIRNEFARLAYPFKSSLLCTVKLSRALYPDADGHSLEKIIRRHQIVVANRHRALDDAKATYKFIEIAEQELGAEKIRMAIRQQGRRESLPPIFNPSLLDALPNCPGVYYFWGINKELLYVGKSVDIRKRVMSHFTADHKSSREMKLCQQTHDITFDKTSGELTALILESQQIKAMQPIYNRKLRRASRLYSIALNENPDGLLTPAIITLSDEVSREQKLYGLFPSAKKALQSLQSLVDQYNLCYQATGLEKINGRPCMSHQMRKCKGLCAGKQKAVQHNVYLLEGLAKLALQTWPFPGPVMLKENERDSEYLVIDNWCVIGRASESIQHVEPLKGFGKLDRDIYRYLVQTVRGRRGCFKSLAPVYT